MRYAIAGMIAAILALSAAPVRADDDLMKRALQDIKPIPSVVPAVKDNAVTHEKVDLGKLLFFDPRLSASEIISCNTCHNLGTGGVDAGPTSVGPAGRRVRVARPPSTTRCSMSRNFGTAAPPTLRRGRRAPS
jgi:cytochrome c peroxidase